MKETFLSRMRWKPSWKKKVGIHTSKNSSPPKDLDSQQSVGINSFTKPLMDSHPQGFLQNSHLQWMGWALHSPFNMDGDTTFMAPHFPIAPPLPSTNSHGGEPFLWSTTTMTSSFLHGAVLVDPIPTKEQRSGPKGVPMQPLEPRPRRKQQRETELWAIGVTQQLLPTEFEVRRRSLTINQLNSFMACLFCVWTGGILHHCQRGCCLK